MNSYLDMAAKYMAAHKKRTRLSIAGAAIAVALVTCIFSMLDAFLQYERAQIIRETGNYHAAVAIASAGEIQAIENRIDVENSGTFIYFKNGSLNGKTCRLAAIDRKFAADMNVRVIEGRHPTAENEIMLEEWAANSFEPALKTGDNVKIVFADNTAMEFTISGIYKDFGNTKASGMPGVFISMAKAGKLEVKKAAALLVRFKNGVNVNAALESIRNTTGIPGNRIARNEKLLAAIGQSTDRRALSLYTAGAVLFCIVLAAGVIMIFNTFNISVTERVRQFGLLRCLGASRAQIRKLVKREGFVIMLAAIPTGIAAGIFITFACCLVLRIFVGNFFGEMPVFTVSIIGIAMGVLVGILTIAASSYLPAGKASRVPPVAAATGRSEFSLSRKKKLGLLARLFPAEIAIGIGSAVMRKRTLALMSCSISVSIILFLGFQVFIDFMYSALKTTKPYTPDISLVSESGLDAGLCGKLSSLDGVKKVYGRMYGYVEATFAASRLTGTYREIAGDIAETGDGLFVPPEKTWLVSYDKNQLEWANADLLEGDLSPEKLDEGNGIIAVNMHLRNNVTYRTTSLETGDRVFIKTPSGTREMTVMAVLRTVPLSSPQLSLTTFITTEKLFSELTGKSEFKVIDLQLDARGQEQTIKEIRGMLDQSVAIKDHRQENAEIDQTFYTMAVFVYGFVIAIAFIGILNIINTMSTSIAAKTRYLGIMMAAGMSGRQLAGMAAAEAATYGLGGCAAGFVLGIWLQKSLIAGQLSLFRITWKFPLLQVVVILAAIALAIGISVTVPLKRVRERSISENIGAL